MKDILTTVLTVIIIIGLIVLLILYYSVILGAIDDLFGTGGFFLRHKFLTIFILLTPAGAIISGLIYGSITLVISGILWLFMSIGKGIEKIFSNK